MTLKNPLSGFFFDTNDVYYKESFNQLKDIYSILKHKEKLESKVQGLVKSNSLKTQS